MDYKPFNLELAMCGEKIITRNGERAEFIAHVPEGGRFHKVVARIGEFVVTFGEDGMFGNFSPEDRDLFMAPRKRTVWLNFYQDNLGGEIAHVHTSERNANNAAGHLETRMGGRTYSVEIEE